MKKDLERLEQLKTIEDSPNLAIVDAIDELKDSVNAIEFPEYPTFPEIIIPEPLSVLSIKNAGEISAPILKGLDSLRTVLTDYFNKEEKKEESSDKGKNHKELIDSIKAIYFPENYDYTTYLDAVLIELRKDSKQEKYLKEIIEEIKKEKEYFPSELIEYDRIKVKLDKSDIKELGKGLGASISVSGGGSSENVRNTLGSQINPATEEKQDGLILLSQDIKSLTETIQELVSRLAFLEGLRGTASDLRVTPLSLPTLATVTTVGTLTNQTNIGGVPANGMVQATQNNIAVQSNINNIGI